MADPLHIESSFSQKAHIVIVVEDNEAMRDLLTDFLTSEGYEVRSFSSAFQALAALREGGECDVRAKKPIDALIADLAMPVMDGAALLEIVHAERPEIPVILVTAFEHLLSEPVARKLGAAAYLQKPFPLEVLKSSIEKNRRAP